jgi:hypothetical protein
LLRRLPDGRRTRRARTDESRPLRHSPRGCLPLRRRAHSASHSREKDFFQNGTENAPELYRLSKVKAAVAAGETIYVVGGEKDVHALEVLGVTATTNPMGENNWSKVDPSPLYGAARVVIIGDRDKIGSRFISDRSRATSARST